MAKEYEKMEKKELRPAKRYETPIKVEGKKEGFNYGKHLRKEDSAPSEPRQGNGFNDSYLHMDRCSSEMEKGRYEHSRENSILLEGRPVGKKKILF